MSSARASNANRNHTEWRTASPLCPCPICSETSGCQREIDGGFASCARHPSDWPLTNGAWLHKVLSAAPTKLAIVARNDVGAATNLQIGLIGLFP
jgi:hypothetical protein